MKTVQEIYEEYKIMPSLQLHQLRVAGVAQYICERTNGSVDTKAIALACLFHDMGNIIKSELRYFPEFTAPEGVEYWERVKAEFISKYGEDHHTATSAIAREIGLPVRSLEILDIIGYSHIGEITASDDWEKKIAEYSDTRVGPRGVLLLAERLQEGRKRYEATSKSRAHYDTENSFKILFDTAHELERQVCDKAGIGPEEVNDAAIEAFIEELRKYAVA